MPVGAGFLSAFLNRVVSVVLLEGDPFITHNVGGAPACAGFAFDGTYFYLNDIVGPDVHVYTAAGVFVRTMNISEFYYDIDYDPVLDELLGVSPSYTGIYRFSKTDGSLIGTYGPAESAFLNDNFTSIAVDRYNDLLYLEHSGGMWIYVLKMSTFGYERMIYVPYEVVPAPVGSITSTMMIALDAEDKKKIWVGYKSFPPLFARVDEDDKIDAFRVLGTGFYGVKSSIGIRYVNERWYCWVGAGDGIGKLYSLSGMPGPLRATPALIVPAFDQDIYRWYENDDAENPTPKAAENAEIPDVDIGEILRIRLGIEEKTGTSVSWRGRPRLQFADDQEGPWYDVGEQGETDRAWRFYDGLGVDGDEIAELLLSITTVKQYFMESTPAAYGFDFRGPDRGEWDLCIEGYKPFRGTTYYLRLLLGGGLIDEYTSYPKLKVISWKDLGWDYRRQITIQEQSGGTYNDYPTIVNVQYDPHMKNDFSDCRFTDADGFKIPYGIVEKVDGVSCAFVIVKSYTPAASHTVYLYYGNPAAADESVDHGPWARNWYKAHYFGSLSTVKYDTNCSNYKRESSRPIPSWVAVSFGGVEVDGAKAKAYYGRAWINSVGVPWGTTAVCFGASTLKLLKWKKYYCAEEHYDHPAWNPGVMNTIRHGHYDDGDPGYMASWYPTDPSVSIGAEEPT